ncbi:hypothetical protein QYF36_012090 [Acer negundo]|nr:hypothetical protein QYF36_012090 [Acer negundo]
MDVLAEFEKKKVNQIHFNVGYLSVQTVYPDELIPQQPNPPQQPNEHHPNPYVQPNPPQLANVLHPNPPMQPNPPNIIKQGGRDSEVDRDNNFKDNSEGESDGLLDVNEENVNQEVVREINSDEDGDVEQPYRGKAFRMHPIPDEHSWPDVQYGTVLLPLKKKRDGRPKLQRRRGLNEGRKVPRSIGFRCSICEEVGHNSRTCTNKG